MANFESTRKQYELASLLIGSSVLVVGCNDGSSGNVFTPPEPITHITHASPDAPRVNDYLNVELVLENVDFKENSGDLGLDSGSFEAGD